MNRNFEDTRWSVVIAAANDDTEIARNALEKLFQTYSVPLFYYIRRRGYSFEDADDLLQEFFTQLLESQGIRRADRKRGRFRTFLLKSLKNFLANEWDRRNTAKRGAGLKPLSLDLIGAEKGFQVEVSSNLSPDKIYERQWVMSMLDSVLGALRDEYMSNGKERLFEALKAALTVEGLDSRYKDIGEQLGVSEGAIKVTVYRMRLRYRQLLREELMQTVTEPEELQLEIKDLFRTFD